MTAISCQISHNIAEVILDNPATSNAMGWEFWDECPRLFQELQTNNDVRVVLISAQGKHFSAGLDLQYAVEAFGRGEGYDAHQIEAITQYIEGLQDIFLAVEKLDKPVIAAIHGACIGAGLELACSADIRLCSHDAFFALKELQLGIIPDLGGLQRLQTLLPQGVARELTYTGRQFSASEALTWGLVNQCFDDQQTLLQEARTLASAIAAQSPLAVKLAKRAFIDQDHQHLERRLRPMALQQAALCMQGDMSEAMQAMYKKVTPKYKNRQKGPAKP